MLVGAVAATPGRQGAPMRGAEVTPLASVSSSQKGSSGATVVALSKAPSNFHFAAPQLSAELAVAAFAGELAPTIAVPNRVLTAVREILSCQQRFQKTPGRNGRGVVSRLSFPDALSYLRFMEQLAPPKRSLADWWQRFSEDQTGQHPEVPPAGEAGAGAEAAADGAGRKRKRRRRRRKKPSAAPQGE